MDVVLAELSHMSSDSPTPVLQLVLIDTVAASSPRDSFAMPTALSEADIHRLGGIDVHPIRQAFCCPVNFVCRPDSWLPLLEPTCVSWLHIRVSRYARAKHQTGRDDTCEDLPQVSHLLGVVRAGGTRRALRKSILFITSSSHMRLEQMKPVSDSPTEGPTTLRANQICHLTDTLQQQASGKRRSHRLWPR